MCEVVDVDGEDEADGEEDGDYEICIVAIVGDALVAAAA